MGTRSVFISLLALVWLFGANHCLLGECEPVNREATHAAAAHAPGSSDRPSDDCGDGRPHTNCGECCPIPLLSSPIKLALDFGFVFLPDSLLLPLEPSTELWKLSRALVSHSGFRQSSLPPFHQLFESLLLAANAPPFAS